MSAEAKVIAENSVMVPVGKLKEFPGNPRRGDKEAIKESILENGFFDPLIVRKKNGHVLSGNHRLQAAIELGMEEVPVVYVDVSAKEAKKILLSANRASDKSTYDAHDLMKFLEPLEASGSLGGTLWSGADLKELLDDDDEASATEYTGKIVSPCYEPSEEKPSLKELTDDLKTKKLIASIKGSDLPSEDKKFLINAAQRHRVFKYDKIADYYAHSSPEVQELMEQSALVIIDFEKAIEHGFTELSEDIRSQYISDYPERTDQ